MFLIMSPLLRVNEILETVISGPHPYSRIHVNSQPGRKINEEAILEDRAILPPPIINLFIGKIAPRESYDIVLQGFGMVNEESFKGDIMERLFLRGYDVIDLWSNFHKE